MTPGGNQTVTKGSVVQYTVSGLGSNPVDIQLFNCDNVSTSGSNGQTTFTGTNPGGSGNYAKPGSTNGSVTVVNGAAGGSTTGVTPNNGQVTFSVTDNTAGDCLVPVVFQQGSGANADSLPLNADGTPSVPFGTGGETSFVQYGTPGPLSATTVKSETGSTFTDSGNITYKYSSSDVYQLHNAATGKDVPDTYADFQQRLSQGDSVSGYYNSPNQSTFVLNDLAPEPGAVTATGSAANSGGVDLTIAPSGSSDVTSYNIYRATATAASGATGAPSTCPPNPGTPGQSPQVAPSTSAAWTKIGTVSADAKKTSGNYTYTDATPAPATGTAPSYCYLVSAVGPNAAGTSQEGTGKAPSQNASGGVTPSKAGVAAGAPAFASSFTPASGSATNAGATASTVSNVTTFSITAPYANGPILCSSVDALGSDYSAVYTDANGVNHQVTVTGAACSNPGPNGGGNIVTITGTSPDFTSTPSGGHIVVTAKKGADTNTVSNTDTTSPLYQAVGDSLYVPVA